MNAARKALCQAYVTTLKEGFIPWESAMGSEDVYMNAVTGIEYQGINRLMLMAFKAQSGYTSCLWITKSQARAAGLVEIEGHEGAFVEMYMMGKNDNPHELLHMSEYSQLVLRNPKVAGDYSRVPITYKVYNIEAFENPDRYIEGACKRANDKVFQADFVKNLVSKLGVDVYEDLDDLKKEIPKLNKMEIPKNTAFYLNDKDKAYVPAKEGFKSEYDYYATLLHELCHSTGDTKRLNRPFLKEEGSEYGSIGYAKEELRAEIASSFLTQDLALKCNPKNLTNHRAYIKSWVSILEESYMELSRAIDEAFLIEEYILNVGEFKKYYKGKGVDKSAQ